VRASLILVLLLAGCAGKTEVIRPLIICPDMPVLPIVYAEELDSLSDDVYNRVIDRDQGWQNYSEELLVICKAVHDHGSR